jgi:hypothetical protein
MSSLTTEQQRDDLAARRRRKQAQETAAPNGDAVAALQSSQAARGLIRDVITGIPDQTPAGAGLEEGVSHTRARETDRPDSPPRVPTSRAVTSDGERVDDLVRRVKEGASAASAEAIASGAHSRPKGTADLAADAAVKERDRQLRISGSPRSSLAKRARIRGWGAAAFALAIGVAIVALAINSSGSRLVGRTTDLTATQTHQGEAGTEIFGGAVRKTIIGVGSAMKARAVLASAQARSPHRERTPNGQHSRSQIRFGATRRHRAATGQRSTSQASRAIAATSDVRASAPRLATTSEAHSNTPPSAGVSTSESATPHNSSTTATSHPAGPTGSNPLGGIGSCVKGC